MHLGPRSVLILLIVPLIWGANFPIAKVGISDYPPVLFIALRLLLTGLVLLPFAALPLGELKRVLAISITLGSLNFGLLILAIDKGNTAFVLLVYQMNIVFGVLAAAFLYGETVSPLQRAGLAAALVGLFLVFGAPNMSSLDAALLTLLAAGAFGFGQTKVRTLKGMTPLSINAWVSVFSGLQLLGLSCLFELESWSDLPLPSDDVIGALLYTSLVAGVVAYGLWYGMLRSHPLVLVLPFGLLTPIFGFVITRLLFGEAFDLPFLVGAAVTLIALSFITAERAWLRGLRSLAAKWSDAGSRTLTLEGDGSGRAKVGTD